MAELAYSAHGFERLMPNTRFAAELEVVFATPLELSLSGNPTISPEELVKRERYYSQKATQPDDHEQFIQPFTKRHFEVVTDVPEDYVLLLAQAVQLMNLQMNGEDSGLIITDRVAKTARHERAHGAMAQSLGILSVYGVGIMHDPSEDIWALRPFHHLQGPAYITKLEEAAIAVAPDDASESDIHSALSAGYEGRNEILTKFYAIHPEIAAL